MIVLIGGEKGGTSKTTIATNLAAMRAAAGKDVLLIDTDIQGSASYWSASRDETDQPRVACVQKFGKGLQAEVRDLAKRYGDVVIDAGGRDSVELRAALVVADKTYVPIQASQFDIWTLDRMDKLVETAKGFNPELQAYVLISRASTNPSVTETSEAAQVLEDFENLTLVHLTIRDRIVFRRAAREGLSVTEYKPTDPKAVKEIRNLYEEIFDEKVTG